MDLSGRVAAVTGAGSGLGRAGAEALTDSRTSADPWSTGVAAEPCTVGCAPPVAHDGGTG
jgi:NAD(P)-dependent dehydrogenase (short-subunit alcohol dehydrogenase family)